MTERLQKIIAASGLSSRRGAEDLIRQGKVKVNGRKASIGDSADPYSDLITVEGKPLPTNRDMVYIMLNKPRGYVTTLSDERGRKTVAQLVSDAGTRVFPVGRLDMDSEGLVLMTNDGAVANRLAHPSYGVKKTYNVKVSGENLVESVEKIRAMDTLDGESIARASIMIKRQNEDGTAVIEIRIGQGKNRQVRRMCAAAGLNVIRLKRVEEGGIELGGLRTGKWRYLTEKEIRLIKGRK